MNPKDLSQIKNLKHMEIDDLRAMLKKQDVMFEIIQHEIPIKSKQDALGIFKIEESAPTLIIKTEVGFYAVIISGERDKIDFKMIKDLLGCKEIGMAKKKEILDVFGMQAGQVPLIGHNLPCIIDNRLFKREYVYGGTGNWYYTLKINPNALVKANNVVLQLE